MLGVIAVIVLPFTTTTLVAAVAPTVTSSPRSARCRRSSPPWRGAVVPEVGLMPSAAILVAVRHHDAGRRRDADRHRLAPRRKRRSNPVKAPFRWYASIAGEIHEITFL
jgi:hypothetical protein